MANKSLFQSRRGATPPETTDRNEAGGLAYTLTPRHALAQLAATGCLGEAFYASGEAQLDTVLILLKHVDVTPEFVAKVAVYARQRGFMKDMPAVLLAWLRNQGAEGAKWFERAWPHVVTNGKMLRNVVQILRSGKMGKHRALKGVVRRLIHAWFAVRRPHVLLRDSVGTNPSLGDIIKLARPKPMGEAATALYGWLIGKVAGDDPRLPAAIREYEAFKKDPAGKDAPDVPMQMLTSLPLTREHWVAVARRGWFHQTRINLNNYARKGVFEVEGLTAEIAGKLRDPETIRKAKVFPYQLLVSYLATTGQVRDAKGQFIEGRIPKAVTEALQDALEVATENVPALEGKVYVCVDVSGSMSSPITGARGVGATTVARCVDVAALIASAILRKNHEAEVIPFDTVPHTATLNPRDTVLTNAQKLAKYGGGGTDCASVLRMINGKKGKGDLVIIVSDMESWVDTHAYAGTGLYGQSSGVADEWATFKSRNPKARLVCINLQAYTTVQAPEQPDTLNIGGFSDAVFEILAEFARGTLAAEHWLAKVEALDLAATDTGEAEEKHEETVEPAEPVKEE